MSENDTMSDQEHVPRREFDSYQVPEEWEADEDEEEKPEEAEEEEPEKVDGEPVAEAEGYTVVQEEAEEGDVVLTCPECGSQRFEEDSAEGQLVCVECGMIVDENRIDESAEWRAFNQEEREKKARAGQ
ncbi:MAG: TFIIB-type zinc ribbon-containing protein, partial [Candidatus Nanohaloarchaea archaeon]